MVSPWKRTKAILLLEDGTIFRGYAFAGQGRALGEVVFNTSMTGYQEVLTDPSYKGQMVAMTYPLTGTYGINDEDMESATIRVEAFIVKEYQDFASNWRSTRTLADFLNDHHKIGIEGLDTRALTRHIRVAGAMRGIIATDTDDVAALMEEVQAFPGLNGIDLVQYVTCAQPYRWCHGPKLARILLPGLRGRRGSGWRPWTAGSSTTSCACSNEPDVRSSCSRRILRLNRSWRPIPTVSSFPMVRAIRRRCTRSLRRCGGFWESGRSLGSVSVTR